jgi:hypothetical protein
MWMIAPDFLCVLLCLYAVRGLRVRVRVTYKELKYNIGHKLEGNICDNAVREQQTS